MLASELAERLENLIKKHGDWEVKLENEELILPFVANVEYEYYKGGIYSSPVAKPCFVIS